MQRAFTLIELLVVISIIALLIAILLPALSKAKDETVWTQCLVNERSVYTANTAHAADVKGLFIPGQNNPDRTNWAQVGLDGPRRDTFNSYGYEDSTWQCPGREFQVDYNPSTGRLNHTYQYFGGMTKWRIGGTVYDSRSPISIEQSTADMAMISDATIQPVTGSWQATNGYYYNDMQPHGSNYDDNRPIASNHVFGDGSGSRIQGSELIALHSWSNSRQPFWFQKDLGDYTPAP